MTIYTGFSLLSSGVDTSVEIFDAVCDPVRLGHLSEFHAVPQIGEDGRIEGHRLSFVFDRDSAEFESRFAAIENGEWDGEVVVIQTIHEPDGSVSRYRYLDVSLRPTDFGTWSGQRVVKLGCEAVAKRKVRLS